MTTMQVDLRAEAAAEVQRLLRARAFAREGDERVIAQLEADGPWITAARRPTLRRFLGRRLMLIWRIAYEDAGGGRAESRLVPVVIELSAAAGPWTDGARAFPSSARRESSSELRELATEPETRGPQASVGTARTSSRLTALLRAVDSDVRARIDTDGREWQETVERVVRSFTSARIVRERAIAIWLARADRKAFQPGLFDRRAERGQRVHAAAGAETDRLMAERLATVERLAAVARRPAQLLLVLTP
jgi:hypothetical protein